MDKKTTTILLILFLLISVISIDYTKYFKVIKIVDATKFYVDFNQNKIADLTELVEYYNINNDINEINAIDKAKLNYLATKYVKENLLNKAVFYKVDSDGNKRLTLKTGEDYIDLLTQKGFIYSDKYKAEVIKNLEIANLAIIK